MTQGREYESKVLDVLKRRWPKRWNASAGSASTR